MESITFHETLSIPPITHRTPIKCHTPSELTPLDKKALREKLQCPLCVAYENKHRGFTSGDALANHLKRHHKDWLDKHEIHVGNSKDWSLIKKFEEASRREAEDTPTHVHDPKVWEFKRGWESFKDFVERCKRESQEQV